MAKPKPGIESVTPIQEKNLLAALKDRRERLQIKAVASRALRAEARRLEREALQKEVSELTEAGRG